MHDVVALGQRPGGGRRRRLPVPPRPPEPAGPAEDLVVGEHPESGHDEPAVERPDGQGGPRRAARAVLEQLLQPLQLSFVVAEDERGGRAAQQRAQPVQVAVDPLRREEPELQVRPLVAEQQPGKAREPLAPALRRLENVLPPGHLLAEPAGDLEVMAGLVPRPPDLVPVGSRGLLDDDGVGGEQLEQGAAPGSAGGGIARRSSSHSSLTAWVVIGSTVISLSSWSERWVVRSNPRIEETSSPHHSSRAGAAMPKP